MARQIYIVTAQIVDSNGTFNVVSGYPKTFDSNNYQGDIEKARRRAEGELSDAWGAMCKRDDRQIQTAILMDVYGNVLERKSNGWFPEIEPEPEE